MADGKVTIETAIDKSGAKKDLNQLTSILKKAGGLIAGYFSAKALISFGKEAIELASDIQEVQNVVDTAFGSMSYKMEEFADTAIEMYGISKLSAKRTGSTFMAMASGMGIAIDNASDMAIALTGLSADMASFYNVSQDVASTALKSIFTGETETLKQFGVVMTETNLQEFAYRQGINKKIQAMTQAEKVQLRYNYVLAQTALAQGDFSKTSDSWANQTRILSERWKEFMSIVGTGLIQVLTPALRVLNQFVAYLITAAQNIANFFGIQTSVASASISTTNEAVESMEDLASATDKANKSAKKSISSFDELNNVTSSSGSGTDVGGGVGMTLSSPVINTEKTAESMSLFEQIFRTTLSNIEKMFSPFINDLNRLWNDFVIVWNSFGVPAGMEIANVILNSITITVQLLGNVISDIWNSLLYPIFSSFINNILPVAFEMIQMLSTIFGTTFRYITLIIKEVWNDSILPIFNLIVEIVSGTFITIKDAWDKYGKTIFESLMSAISDTGDTFMNIWNTALKPFIDGLIEGFRSLWEQHLQPIFESFLNLIGELSIFILDLYNDAILPLINYLVDNLTPIIAPAIEWLGDVFSGMVGIVLNGVEWLLDSFTSILEFLNSFKGKWAAIWTIIKLSFMNTFTVIVNFGKKCINLLIGAFNGLINAVETSINFIIDAINQIHFDVPDWVPGIGGQSWGFNIPKKQFGRIPYLASGAVLPANNPFLAVVGDQRSGTNIEAPLDTIKQALREELELLKDDKDIVIKIDEREIFRVVRNKAKSYQKMSGCPVF